MIAFASLFLGLIVGPEPIEVLVGDTVAVVEIRLGDRSVGELRGAPWSLICDFGPELRPHELTAIAYDPQRRELARAHQWVNLPRRPAEASVVLEGGQDGRGVSARLSWESVVAAQPATVSVTFDGRALTTRDPQRVALPDHDPEKLHFLRVELDFARNVTTVLELVFGGSYADRLDVQLTAVPVILDRGAELPPVATLAGGLLKRGRPLAIVATEEGPAEVIIVRDEGVRKTLNRLGRTSEKTLRRHARVGLRGTTAKSLRFKMSPPSDQQIRFVWPFPERQEKTRLDFDLLIPSQPFTARDGGLYWLLTEYSPPAGIRREQRLADAVAVAGLLAAGRNRRRAVVLVLGTGANDSSRFSPRDVRGYLRRLGVPLFVWSPGNAGSLPKTWGPIVDISSMQRLEQATKDLQRRLARQRIVWVEGVHLPEVLSLAPDIGPIRLTP